MMRETTLVRPATHLGKILILQAYWMCNVSILERFCDGNDMWLCLDTGHLNGSESPDLTRNCELVVEFEKW